MFPIKINFNTYLEKSVFPPTNHAKVSYLVQAEETFLTGFFLRKTAGVVPHPKSWFYCHLAEDLSQFPLIVNCILCSTIKTGWRILVSFLTLWFCAYFSIIFILKHNKSDYFALFTQVNCGVLLLPRSHLSCSFPGLVSLLPLVLKLFPSDLLELHSPLQLRLLWT